MLDHQLVPGKCFSPSGGAPGRVCGKRVLEPFHGWLAFNNEWPSIHEWLAYMQRHGGVTQQWIDRVVFNPNRVSSRSARWADEVIWHEDMNFAMGDHTNCVEVYRRLEAAGENPTSWLLHECQAEYEGRDPTSPLYATIGSFPQDLILPEDFKRTLTVNPAVKFYLYSGELDPESPVAIFSDELSALGALARYTDFPNSGHDGFYSEDLVWRNLIAN
jgi:hypothetical protein